MRVAVLVAPNAVPRLDERQEGLHSRRRRTSVLVRRCREVIRQAGNVLNQLVDRWRRLWKCEKSTDFVGTAKPARLLADQDGARGDWLGERGNAIEGISGRLASRSNLSAPAFENDLPILATEIEHALLPGIDSASNAVESADVRSTAGAGVIAGTVGEGAVGIASFPHATPMTAIRTTKKYSRICIRRQRSATRHVWPPSIDRITQTVTRYVAATSGSTTTECTVMSAAFGGASRLSGVASI